MALNDYRYKYIYATFNLVNGKFYVGSHMSNKDPNSDKYLGSGVRIKYAIRKYGRVNFKREIIEFYHGEDIEEFRDLETYWINSLEAVTLGYNLKESANSPYTEGKSVGDKIAKTLRGVPKSESHKRNLSKSKQGSKPWNLGVPCREEVKKKIQATSKKRVIPREHIEKMHKAVTGVPKSKRFKKIISDSWKNREEIKCPHCGLKSKSLGNMNRYHFNNCKSKS